MEENKNFGFEQLPPETTNIHFTNKLENGPNLNILNYLYYYNGAGVITADFNNDNLIDVYVAANQKNHHLYLNQGNMQFKEAVIYEQETLLGSWSTGVSQVDINNDGLLDIYICKAAGYRSLKGKNVLLVNKGIGKDGIPTFKDEATKYGIDFSGLSTKATFLDYDLDGDLDLFLLNHSVHPNINYGKGVARKKFDSISGDRLFRNDNGHFNDVSKEAGIFQSKLGYGLGISVSDINLDGYPDIYIGNDFFENDYLYVNQKDGTFTEVISAMENPLGHTTHFSMGNSIADVNNDTYPDIVSLDMLPEDLQTYKTSGLEYGYPIYKQYLKNGFAPQYMQNTLHLNNNNGNSFSEIAHLSGIAATEWSWGSLLADFDNDGFKDLYITNGIKGATNDMDYMNFIANEDIQRRIDSGMKTSDMPLIQEIPQKKIPNYIFKNNGNLTFSNVSDKWTTNIPTFSNGCAYADLNNDGLPEIVINNIDEPIGIMLNKNDKKNYLKLKLRGGDKNRHAFGAKLFIYHSNRQQYLENYPNNVYLSSNSNQLMFGIDNDSIIDSLKVIWPNQSISVIRKIKSNQLLNLRQPTNSIVDPTALSENSKNNLAENNSLGIIFKHQEKQTLDFNREPLIPYAQSNEGPTISVADVNLDGLDDFFIGGAKLQSGHLYVQQESGSFSLLQPDLFQNHAINEDIASVFTDVNNDNFPDLIVASGGNEFVKGHPLQPRLYLNQNGHFTLDSTVFQGVELNASRILPCDVDTDGDIDLILCSDLVSSSYGTTPEQYIFINDGNGNFINKIDLTAPELKFSGNVKDLIYKDVNSDGLSDLIVVGHWMPITIYLNNGDKLIKAEDNGLEKTNGWWNSITSGDIDNDGDIDFIAGNWGSNTKFKASVNEPMTLYNYDFDGNEQKEPLITYFHKGVETPFASKDELTKQMPFLNKKFLSYKDFASADLKEIFGQDNLAKASKKIVNELRSTLFINDGTGKFTSFPLPLIAQISSIHNLECADFNNDGFLDLLIAGNNYEISTQLGRQDALHGLLLFNSKNRNEPFDGTFKMLNINGAIRDIDRIDIKGKEFYILGRNNDTPVFFNYNGN